jgi:acyl-coenzyme A synthetase/AMP-(fatty) acid ligase
MLPKKDTYEAVYQGFRWSVPEFYNIGVDVCDKWADKGDRLALIYEDEKGRTRRYTFKDLKGLSNRFANALRAQGVDRGDRVGILLPQCPETAISHLAIYKLGAVAVPLFSLFGPDALQYRLANSGAKAVVTDASGVANSGYRIGPAQIEDCLLKHPAVAMSAVIGKPDAERTEIVKAFLVLEPGTAATEALAAEIQDFVKTRLAAHEYPREIEFVDALPMTNTGRIIRGELRRREVEKQR